jgi:hypothetical protein
MDQVDRPQMVAGYGVPADSSGMLPFSWAEERLVAARNYWVSTTRPDGRPHAMPVWGLWLDGTLIFSTDPASVKGRNIATQPAVIVHLESGDDVVIVEGRAEQMADADLPADFVDDYERKYDYRVNPADPAVGFYLVRPQRILAWVEVDFPSSTTRFTMREP